MKTFFADLWAGILDVFRAMEFTDIIDIVLVAMMFYYAYKFLRQRRAGKLALGVVLVVLILLIAQAVNMRALEFILQNILQVGLIAIIVVFQPELRSMLETVGGKSLSGIKSIRDAKDNQTKIGTVRELCDTVMDLSRSKTGALIVLERGTKLGDVIKSGVPINADVNAFLLKNIFFDKAPLHDGAVVIRQDRICAAGCFLPLSQSNEIIKDLGTRHRAAIGMSENSDALIIVVSEETGTVSLAYNGELKRGFDYMSLYSILEQMYANEVPGSGEKNPVMQYFRMFTSKVVAKEGKEGKDTESAEKQNKKKKPRHRTDRRSGSDQQQ